MTELKGISKIPLGDPSLQNAIDMAANNLSHIPQHASKEILLLFGSLHTCDPGNIFTSIRQIKEREIRANIVGLGAQVRLCETISNETNGFLF
jgi:transcription initiation factor TFIIH subunit 2